MLLLLFFRYRTPGPDRPFAAKQAVSLLATFSAIFGGFESWD
jgi:hypothetical protein